ncbi:septum site-determining protein MinC [Skermanella mucosa]|uniref:septum site-determining protein MinC n=1 Tax=Skermanella mucosa TaxID=1789672 RepID=UPI00192A74E5|nr:septum site-determining protein MinC [Skermanella mucosa]UEM21887.1 septum site-determining protein MinC [Skermanella mucosa]
MRSTSQISERDAPFQLRGNSFTVMVLKLVAPDDPSFFPQLLSKIRQAPNFFRNAPVVLDLDDLEEGAGPADFIDFVVTLRQNSLIPVGIQGGTPAQQAAAFEAGLTVMPTGRPSREPERDFQRPAPGRAPTDPLPPRNPMPQAETAPEFQKTTLIITEPVRSGRQIYAARGDLIVLGPVSAGAELLADGNIHVYSSLRGRALAGISGDTAARIFCHSLEAELVSIAGLYRVSEDLDASVFKKQVHIYLDDGYLRMDPLS